MYRVKCKVLYVIRSLIALTTFVSYYSSHHSLYDQEDCTVCLFVEHVLRSTPPGVLVPHLARCPLPHTTATRYISWYIMTRACYSRYLIQPSPDTVPTSSLQRPESSQACKQEAYTEALKRSLLESQVALSIVLALDVFLSINRLPIDLLLCFSFCRWRESISRQQL